ncbi:MAG: hypothetical protein C0448_14415 [Sphingobacteriaceae bacterium]|nr:hypothetical protein [Sphingobacteriaceae bacterium]
MANSLKILLADDHIIVRTGIKLMLSQQNLFTPLIDEASNGEDALKMALNKNYDVILLDINMPKLDGIAVTRDLIKKNIKTPILALSVHKEEYIIKKMISAGAAGYLSKQVGVEELANAIHKVTLSDNYYCKETSETLLKNKSKKERTQKTYNTDLNNVLSEREKQIMLFIVKGYKSQQIADNLYLSKRTIDNHRNNIITKLDVKNTTGLIKYAFQNGILNDNVIN